MFLNSYLVLNNTFITHHIYAPFQCIVKFEYSQKI